MGSFCHMKPKTIKTTTAPAIAGGNPALEAVTGYQTYRKNPSPENWEVFGIKLDQLLKCVLPRTADDQRQEASVRLITNACFHGCKSSLAKSTSNLNN